MEEERVINVCDKKECLRFGGFILRKNSIQLEFASIYCLMCVYMKKQDFLILK